MLQLRGIAPGSVQTVLLIGFSRAQFFSQLTAPEGIAFAITDILMGVPFNTISCEK